MYKYIFFDLDGTIVNSINGTRDSALYALKHFGIDESKNNNLGKIFCGPALKDSFSKYGLSQQQIDEAIKLYRDFQASNTIKTNTIYDGIEEVLKKLKENNKKVFIVTAKLEETAIKILKYLNLDNYFDKIVGATYDGKRITKEEGIKYTIDDIIDFDPQKAIMIGDRASDIKAGIQNNMDTVGVLYGIDERKTLENAFAKYLVSKPIDILNIITK